MRKAIKAIATIIINTGNVEKVLSVKERTESATVCY
jgi:hypothetical protein